MANKHHIVTPIGIAVMPFLFEEDPEYNNYKVSIRVDMKTAEKFKADLLSALKGEQFTTKSPHIPIVEDTREEGMFLIRTASKHKPRVFDSKNTPRLVVALRCEPFAKSTSGTFRRRKASSYALRKFRL